MGSILAGRFPRPHVNHLHSGSNCGFNSQSTVFIDKAVFWLQVQALRRLQKYIRRWLPTFNVACRDNSIEHAIQSDGRQRFLDDVPPTARGDGQFPSSLFPAYNFDHAVNRLNRFDLCQIQSLLVLGRCLHIAVHILFLSERLNNG